MDTKPCLGSCSELSVNGYDSSVWRYPDRSRLVRQDMTRLCGGILESLEVNPMWYDSSVWRYLPVCLVCVAVLENRMVFRHRVRGYLRSVEGVRRQPDSLTGGSSTDLKLED